MATLRSLLLFAALLGLSIASSVFAATIRLTGTITYNGSYSGDTLYVAVLDTAQSDESQLYVVEAYPVGSLSLNQEFTFDLDNATAPPSVWIAALLDVDGGGVETIGDADIVGWYPGTPSPAVLSTATGQSGLDFALPTGEIHGTVTFVPGQVEAEVWTSVEPGCADSRLTRPGVILTDSGVFSILGVYPGSWCLYAYGWGAPEVPNRVCYGDFTCASPTPIELTEGQVVNGANLSFVDVSPVQRISWGTLKSRYP